MAVDALGNPVRLIVSAGQVADVTQVEALSSRLEVGYAIADKGYDSNELVTAIEAAGASAVTPPRSNRKGPPALAMSTCTRSGTWSSGS